MQQEVEDIRSELVKLLRTLNTTNAGILGVEHELKEKVRFERKCARCTHGVHGPNTPVPTKRGFNLMLFRVELRGFLELSITHPSCKK